MWSESIVPRQLCTIKESADRGGLEWEDAGLQGVAKVFPDNGIRLGGSGSTKDHLPAGGPCFGTLR